MKISIITPTKNDNQRLFNTIKHLNNIKQTLEVIVINGGDLIIDSYDLNELNLKCHIISEPDNGISDAFNKGIALASSDYVLILNAGDVLSRDALTLYQSAIDEYPDAEIYYGDIEYIEKNAVTYQEHPDMNNIWKYMSIFHPGMLVKKSAYKKIGVYNLNYHYAMDSEWVHRAIKHNLKFKYIPHVLARMELGGKSDKYYYLALYEFFKSSMKHGPSKIKPIYCFIRQMFVHTLLKIEAVKRWRLKARSSVG